VGFVGNIGIKEKKELHPKFIIRTTFVGGSVKVVMNGLNISRENPGCACDSISSKNTFSSIIAGKN
jgi:hypothetical protein